MPEFIDFRHIKANADVRAVLAHYKVTIARERGDQLRINCPFHDDERPSCEVNAAKRNFNCFACGAHGNILDFVAKLGSLELRDAARVVAELSGITASGKTDRAKRAKPTKEAPKIPETGTAASSPETPVLDDPGASDEVPNKPLAFFLNLDPGHSYLTGRVSREAIVTFGLGHCTRGLLAGRIGIPIHNANGELVAYAGRYASDEVPPDVERYLFPSRFRKSLVLFNQHRLDTLEHVVLVESFWSVFRLHAMGVPVLSPMGRSISAEQIALLASAGTKRVTLLFDGDEPGRAGRAAALPLLAAEFFTRAPALPEGEKPHTLPEPELRAVLAHAL